MVHIIIYSCLDFKMSTDLNKAFPRISDVTQCPFVENILQNSIHFVKIFSIEWQVKMHKS